MIKLFCVGGGEGRSPSKKEEKNSNSKKSTNEK